MVGQKKKLATEKKGGFSGVQRYGKANSERTDRQINIAETSQMPETSTQDDNKKPTCVGGSRRKRRLMMPNSQILLPLLAFMKTNTG